MPNRRCAIIAGAAFVCLGFTAAGHADVVNITSSLDNTLYENDNGLLSNGEGDHFFVGRTFQGSGSIRRGLLYFDIAGAIPAGATINSVTLTLNMSQTIAGDVEIFLHRSLAAWGEGASHASGQEGAGAPSASGDATWIHTNYSSNFWTTAGGDFDGVASASQTVGVATGQYNWSSATLISDVQGWLDAPGTNFGWFLIGDESIGGTAKRFDTHENPITGNRPTLQIDYTVVPAPGALALFGLGALGLNRRRRRR